MNNALIILCLTISCFADCGTVSYVSRLSDLQIRKSERRVTWIDTDYVKIEKNDKYLDIGLSNSDAGKYFFLFIKVKNSGKWSGSIRYFDSSDRKK